MKQVMLFFGSFNPVHKGHVTLAEYVLEKNLAEEVWFVLSPQNPFKKAEDLWGEEQRAVCLEKALVRWNAAHDGFGRRMVYCEAELHLPKPSYTIQTLEHLWKTRPDCTFSILMGEDNLAGLHKWKDYRRILESCEIFVYPRRGAATPGGCGAAGSGAATGSSAAGSGAAGSGAATHPSYPIEKEFPQKIHRISAPLLDISSTQIRELLKEGKDVSGLMA